MTLGGDGEALINLALIPEPNRTFNGSGWWDLNIDQQETDGPQSRIASVLFCDPHLEYTTVVATLAERTITLDNASQKKTDRVGNLDPGEVSRMFSRAFNGIVYDQELAYPEASATLSRSSAEFILQPANDSANFIFLPQDLANVSQSMNEYMRVVASNTYLEGSLGTFDTRVDKLELVERLQVSWLQWGLTAGFVLVAALLSTISVVHDKDEERDVAFTIAAVVKALRETYGSDTAGSAVARADPTDDLKPVESLDAPSKPSDQSAISYNGPAVPAMSILNKAWRIVLFAILEAAWLVFGYVTYWHVILVPHLSVHLAGLNPSNDVLFRGLFTTSQFFAPFLNSINPYPLQYLSSGNPLLSSHSKLSSLRHLLVNGPTCCGIMISPTPPSIEYLSSRQASSIRSSTLRHVERHFDSASHS